MARPEPRTDLPDLEAYERRREELRHRYLESAPTAASVATGGVDHLALICSDIERTIGFYTEVLKMRLTKIVPNRDEPSSTHIFLDMGGGNQLAFFDFPRHRAERTVRGIGSMHHVALKATPEKYREILNGLEVRGVQHSVHGNREKGSVYLRDPDDILVEVTTGYD